ncbi:receptor-interacting serine/threonine-protein kinase 3-like isoform 1-T2 [Leptodactylus fuscus]|uniref:receptor-interacting serine/threonine-protein kinase 3-like n=1 Tax=Leptodactylus fuscus TaxID=238119 RepID=UPI003F4F0ED9
MHKKNLVPTTLLTDWCLIDQGHFGSVYKAKHGGYKVTVAVKKLKGNVQQGITELISEAEKMASASASPYVIRLFGILEQNTKEPPGIVMEYMEYGSLCTLMETVGPLPWPLKFRIIYQVTLGMNWLHNLPTPLLHLDLKPKNVLLNEELHIKITDFGLSKYTSGTSSHGHEDCEVGGTLEYMPPEAFQEGYQPSKSTDVYSFAILSAVVLRGENPYPVDKSILIRQLVPRGQRPCLEELENETSVTYLSEILELTRHCWDNDKHKRPSFSECCNKWEKFITAYKTWDIRQAVRCVQDTMENFGKKKYVPYTQESTTVNTKDMSEMVHKLGTMKYFEGPPIVTESVPVKCPPHMQNQPPKVRPEPFPQGSMGFNYRPQSAYHTASVPVMSNPNMQSHPPRIHYTSIPLQGYPPGAMGYISRQQPQYYPGYPTPWNMNLQRLSYQPSFNSSQPFPFDNTKINISNCSNLQIGTNNSLNVTDSAHPGTYHNMIYRQPVHTSPPATMSPPPKQTTQGYYNMPQTAAPTGRPCKQKTVDKSDQQSNIYPIQTTTAGPSSYAHDTPVLQRSISRIEKPTTKDPEQ